MLAGADGPVQIWLSPDIPSVGVLGDSTGPQVSAGSRFLGDFNVLPFSMDASSLWLLFSDNRRVCSSKTHAEGTFIPNESFLNAK